MLAVDTNVLVRLLTNDDPDQARRAAAIVVANDVLVPTTVLLEVEWVLRQTYGLRREDVLRGLHGLLGMPRVVTRNPTWTAAALEWYERGLDFADALHLAASSEADRFVTFDARFAKRARLLSSIEVTTV